MLRTLVAVVALTPILVAHAGKEDLLDTVGKKLDIAYSNRDPESPYTDKTLEKLRTSTAACLKAVDDALAAGATLDDEVRMPIKQIGHAKQVKNKHGAWVYMAPMREAQTYCRDLAAKPNALQLNGVLQAADGWLGKASRVQAEASAKTGLDRQAVAEADAMTAQVEPCHAAIAKATAAGVAPTTTLELKTAGSIALADADAKVCTALDTAAKAIVAIEDAKLEKMLAPYKAALKGDRIKTFIDRKMIFDDIYGPGGSRLDTPAKLAGARAWFIVLSGDVGLGLKTVTVRRYSWNGNKLGGVAERTGCCTL